MRKHTHRKPTLRQQISIITFSILCIVGSFGMGIRTAGDVETFGRSNAQMADVSADTVLGDLNGNAKVDIEDALIGLYVAEGKRSPTEQELLSDPNHDGAITLEDVETILRSLLLR